MQTRKIASILFLFFLTCSLFYLPVFATTLFSDDFETGNSSAWDDTSSSGATVEVVSGARCNGSYGLQVSGLQSSAEKGFVYIALSGSEYYAQNMYLFNGSLPEGYSNQAWDLSPQFYSALATPSRVAYPAFDSANSKIGIRYYSSSGWVYVWEDGTTSITYDVWYRIEFYILSSNSGNCTLWWNGEKKVTFTADTNTRTLNGLLAGCGYVDYGQSSERTIQIDDVYLADSYIGMGSTSQALSFSLTESVALSANLGSQKAITRSLSASIVISSDLYGRKTITRSFSSVSSIIDNEYSSKALIRNLSVGTSFTDDEYFRKALTRISGESTTIITSLESQKSILAVIVENLENVALSAALQVRKSLSAILQESVIISAVLDVSKHLQATILDFIESILIPDLLAAVLPVQIVYATRGEFLAAAVVASLIFIPLLILALAAVKKRR